jgi:hypothetical protein
MPKCKTGKVVYSKFKAQGLIRSKFLKVRFFYSSENLNDEEHVKKMKC